MRLMPLVISIPMTTSSLPSRRLKNVLSAAEGAPPISLLDTLDDSILSGLYSIAKLGGYMVLFNLLNLVPHALLRPAALAGADSKAIINCLLEITSGISRIGNIFPASGFSLCRYPLCPVFAGRHPYGRQEVKEETTTEKVTAKGDNRSR